MLKLHTAFPCYSCHVSINNGVLEVDYYSQQIDSLIDYPIKVIQTHAFDDICLLTKLPEQSNLFCFGFRQNKVSDKYATEYLWNEKDLSKQAKHVRSLGINVGATLLDSYKHPINIANPLEYAVSVCNRLIGEYHANSIGGDFEWHCSDYSKILQEIYYNIRIFSPPDSVTFYVTCYLGEADLPAIKLLQQVFSDLKVNLMAYTETVSGYKDLIEKYLPVVDAKNIYLGVSVNSTDPITAVSLIELAMELNLGGIFVWNTAQDAEVPPKWRAPDPAIFPFTQMLQEVMGYYSGKRVNKSWECPAKLGGETCIISCEDNLILKYYKRAWERVLHSK